MSRSKYAPLIAPSILAADLAALGDECEAVIDAGADWIHFDVMDNHYVPNLTIGPMVCSALRKYGVTAPIDVHLMVKPVDRIIGDFLEAGASYITFHPEASGGEVIGRLITDPPIERDIYIYASRNLDHRAFDLASALISVSI